MVRGFRALALATGMVWAPLQASAATASELMDQINQCQMEDPVGLRHVFSIKNGAVQLRDLGAQFVGVTSAMPMDKVVFEYTQRSFNPDYGAVLRLACADKSQCVDVKRDTGQTWKADGLQVFLMVPCGKALDLAGKTLPPAG